MRRASGGQLVIRTLAANAVEREMPVIGANGVVPLMFPAVRQADVAGVIEDVGPGATRFARGDRVFGQLMIPPRGLFGSQLDALVVSEDVPLAHIPPGLDPIVAATLPTTAATALDIVDSLEPLHGKTMLVVGDVAGVASFATQFAANAGAHVIAFTDPSAAAEIRAYGAIGTVHGSVAEVMDAIADAHPRGLDLIVDAASDEAGFADLSLLLRPWGTAVTTRNVADVYSLLAAEVIGMNRTPAVTPELLRRVGEAIAERRVFPPRIAATQLAHAA